MFLIGDCAGKSLPRSAVRITHIFKFIDSIQTSPGITVCPQFVPAFGQSLHTGDWKFDDENILGPKQNISALTKFGKMEF